MCCLANLASRWFPSVKLNLLYPGVRVRVVRVQVALEVPWERKHYKILQRGRGGRGMEKEKERNCQYIAFQTG